MNLLTRRSGQVVNMQAANKTQLFISYKSLKTYLKSLRKPE